EQAFGEVGIKLEDLDALVATHHHIDHFGASGEIRRRSHATTHIHRLEAERAGRMIEFGKMSPTGRSRAHFFKSTDSRSMNSRRLECVPPGWGRRCTHRSPNPTSSLTITM